MPGRVKTTCAAITLRLDADVGVRVATCESAPTLGSIYCGPHDENAATFDAIRDALRHVATAYAPKPPRKRRAPRKKAPVPAAAKAAAPKSAPTTPPVASTPASAAPRRRPNSVLTDALNGVRNR